MHLQKRTKPLYTVDHTPICPNVEGVPPFEVAKLKINEILTMTDLGWIYADVQLGTANRYVHLLPVCARMSIFGYILIVLKCESVLIDPLRHSID